MLKVIFASDFHGDHVDRQSLDALLAFSKDFKPNIKILGGDLFDLRPLRKGACHDEKRESMQADWTTGMEILARWRPGVFLRGNHCQRMWDLAESDGVLADFAQNAIQEVSKVCAKLRCEMRNYCRHEGIYKVGDLKFMHGFKHGIHAIRAEACIHGHVCMGHIHSKNIVSTERSDQAVGFSVGSMCNNKMKYNERNESANRQSNGFGFAYVHDSGRFQFYHAEKLEDGSFVIPHGQKRY